MESFIRICVFFEPFEIDLVFMHEKDSLFQYEIIKGSGIYAKDEDFDDEYEDFINEESRRHDF